MDALKSLYPESGSDSSDTESDEDLDGPAAIPLDSINKSNDMKAAVAFPDDLLEAVAHVALNSKKIKVDCQESSSDSGEDSDTASIRTTGTTTRSVISQADRRPPSPYEGFQKSKMQTTDTEKEDFALPSSVILLKIGTIRTILDNTIVVESSPNSPPVDLDSVLFLNEKIPLGRIFDVFGPVIRPLYSLRFESEADFEHTEGLAVGADVFIVPSDPHLTSYVFVKDLLKQRGTDASWEDDGEQPDGMEEFFSDDEKEKEAKQQQQRTKRPLHSGGERSRGCVQARHSRPVMALPRPNLPSVRPQWRLEGRGLGRPMEGSPMAIRYRQMAPPAPRMSGAPPWAGGSPFHGLAPGPSPASTYNSTPAMSHFMAPSSLASDCNAKMQFIPSLPARPYGLSVNSETSTWSNLSSIPTQSVPLVTDPKTLPTAQVLFYNPKNDASLTEKKALFPPRNFLR